MRRLVVPAWGPAAPRRRALAHALVVAGWLFIAWLLVTSQLGKDAYAYWAISLDNLYEGVYGEMGFFPYSPAAALLVTPLSLLPWPVFLMGWTGLLIGTLVWLTGSRWPIFLALPPVSFEIALGNITLLMAVAIVLGFRWPAAWAFVLLTKVTPGIGLLWFAVRREWRNLAMALAATAAIVIVTAAFVPQLWMDWFALLSGGAPAVSVVPLLPRIPVAVALVVWGAVTNRPWTVIAAATLALPRMGMSELSLLVAIYALRRGREVVPGASRPAPALGRALPPPVA